MESKRLNFKDILNAEDFETDTVDTPEWGGHVVIKTMTGKARDAYELSLLKKEGKGYKSDLDNARAKLIAACVINEDGSLMFSGENQIKALGDKNSTVLDRIYDACRKLNKISDRDVEELTGN